MIHPKKGQHDGRFIRAPLPYDWMTAAAQLSGKSLHAALAIRYLAGYVETKPVTVKLTHQILKDFGVSVKTSYEVLKRLEERGLITVERHVGRSPRVTITPVPPKKTILNTSGTVKGVDTTPCIQGTTSTLLNLKNIYQPTTHTFTMFQNRGDPQ